MCCVLDEEIQFKKCLQPRYVAFVFKNETIWDILNKYFAWNCKLMIQMLPCCFCMFPDYEVNLKQTFRCLSLPVCQGRKTKTITRISHYHLKDFADTCTLYNWWCTYSVVYDFHEGHSVQNQYKRQTIRTNRDRFFFSQSWRQIAFYPSCFA